MDTCSPYRDPVGGDGRPPHGQNKTRPSSVGPDCREPQSLLSHGDGTGTITFPVSLFSVAQLGSGKWDY